MVIGMPKWIDMTGQRYGRLIALEYKGDSRWLFKCDCGRAHEAQGKDVRTGATSSCGCLHQELRHVVTRTHGHTVERNPSPTFSSYNAMKARCHNPKNLSFDRYGGRGIRICARWLESFETFLADMGERPVGMTLDRIDGDGNYEPGNCRWTTHGEQVRNQRSNTLDWSRVNEIRGRFEHGETQVSIAARMELDRATIHRVVRCKQWPEDENPYRHQLSPQYPTAPAPMT